VVHLLVPVDEVGLDELDELEADLEGDGDEVVVQDEEGQPVEEEVVVDELAEVCVVLAPGLLCCYLVLS